MSTSGTRVTWSHSTSGVKLEHKGRSSVFMTLPQPVLPRLHSPLLESREMHHGQLNQLGRSINVAYRTSSKRRRCNIS